MSWKKTCNVPAFLTIFIPSTTLVMIGVLIYLCIRCKGGMIYDEEGNIMCPQGADNGVIVIRMCVSVVIMTLVSGIMTLCSWHLWMKKKRQLELQEKMERGLVVGDGDEGKIMIPPEVPHPKKILLPKDMPEHLCLAA